MEAFNDDERDRQWATLLPDPDRDRLCASAPDGWQPPSDERADEIFDEERDA